MARSQSLYLGLTDKQRLFLRGQSQRLSVFDGGVVLMDSTGRVRATVPERWDIMSSDWSNQEFFTQNARRRAAVRYFSSVLDIGPDNTPVIVVSVPVLGQNGEMVGVLAGLFRLGESRTSALLCEHRPAPPARHRQHATSSTAAAGSSTIPATSAPDSRSDLTYARLPTDKPEPKLDPDGNKVVVSYAPVPGTDWTLDHRNRLVRKRWRPSNASAPASSSLLALGMVIPTVGVALLARGQRHGRRDADQRLLEDRASARRCGRPPASIYADAGRLGGSGASSGRASSATAHDLYDYMLLPDGRLMISLATVADGGLSSVH